MRGSLRRPSPRAPPRALCGRDAPRTSRRPAASGERRSYCSLSLPCRREDGASPCLLGALAALAALPAPVARAGPWRRGRAAVLAVHVHGGWWRPRTHQASSPGRANNGGQRPANRRAYGGHDAHGAQVPRLSLGLCTPPGVMAR